MRYVCFTLLIVSLAVPAAFAMEATISNDASGSTGNSISTAPLHDGNTKATQFDQGWDAAVTNIGICEYQNGVDGLLVDDFEITTPGDVGASTTFHVPYNGDGTPPEYTSPTRVDVFMDTDSGSGPSSAYGFPWTADTMTFNAGPSDWTALVHRFGRLYLRHRFQLCLRYACHSLLVRPYALSRPLEWWPDGHLL